MPEYGGDEPIRIVDLFAGCGGMTLGAMEACRSLGLPCEVALAMEVDDDVRAVYQANFTVRIKDEVGNVRRRFSAAVGKEPTRRERETKEAVGRVHVLVGGPPCQGHSTLNNHTRSADRKNSLYMRMVRAAEVLEPDIVVIENVPGVRNDKQHVMKRARRALKKLGYEVADGVVALTSIGVPQQRFRHVLVASRSTVVTIEDIVAEHHVRKRRTLRWALRRLHRRDRGIYDTGSKLSAQNLKRARWLRAHRAYDLPNARRPECHRDDHKYKSMYGRLSWREPAQTITTGFGSPGQGRYLHPRRLRTITPHEAARIQFFPDWFNFCAAPSRTVLAKCIGNAVPPKLGFAVVRSLLKARDRAQSAAGSEAEVESELAVAAE